MTLNSKKKGSKGELEAAQCLTDLGIPARRTQQYSGTEGTSDVSCDAPYEWLHIEVKRKENFNVYAALEQAEEDCTDPSKTPVVLHRRSRKGWIAILSLADFVDLVKERTNE